MLISKKQNHNIELTEEQLKDKLDTKPVYVITKLFDTLSRTIIKRGNENVKDDIQT